LTISNNRFILLAMAEMVQHAFFPPAPSKSERARGRLFAAALEIFGRKGPEGATVREIARAAGQNVAAIAYYFGGKQKLYRAVIEGIVAGILRTLEDVLRQVDALRQSGRRSPEQAAQLIEECLRTIYLRLLSRDDAVAIVQLVVREQLAPSPAFSILYEKGFRHLHETLCFLAGMALGRDPRDQATILRTHMLMGQVYFFAMSREAILRRAGWKSLEGRNAELVTELLKEHLERLLGPVAGCRAKAIARRAGKKSSRAFDSA
jgi:AcrR family transcriptional regulator